ncbi:hypothetical protein NHE_0427 [Neorickettsia helminthoeca str. Oregon]|uniref:Uncharacterized protein n=1 Tax=Neorickettsia helminthoeca str. Oregon TaxID=1286528 RepID=X5GWC9_9RICK|nr:hypothetical protein NHE_0427 [Neorickettsia helminthoeca str. Oregon]
MSFLKHFDFVVRRDTLFLYYKGLRGSDLSEVSSFILSEAT